ncbi:MAG TPA: hypothetical protein VEP89_05465 [Draconibacterium sp.]|nr:hypothetical protein [Draconibacterium sp.]
MEGEQFKSYMENVDALNAETLGEVEKLTHDFPWFPFGWLLYLKNLKNLNHVDYNTVLKKVAIIVPNRKMLFNFLNNEKKPIRQFAPKNNKAAEYYLEGSVELETENSLIDKFLSDSNNRPRGVNVNLRSGKEPGSSVVVEQSLEEDTELVTETLASIYFQQKNFEKALDAYHKLSLKYPEKSVYFAGRIKEIELLKHNN